MKFRFFVAAICGLLIAVEGCSPTHPTEEIETVIRHTQNYFAPDSRTALFEVSVSAEGAGVTLTGETNLPKAKAALLDSLQKISITVTDSIRVLPAKALGQKTRALVNNSVANLRSRPSHPAQLVTQATLGMPLEVLKKDGGWYLVQTPDDYIAWVDDGGIQRMSRAQYQQWVTQPKLIYLKTYGFSRREPATSAGKVSDLVAGSILKLDNTLGGFYAVSYPDGRKAFISKADAKPFSQWQKDLKITKESLVETSKTMMGAPYLWGGTSTKGVDCSGFTKTIYFMNGRIIPRDASQQIKAGKLVDSQKNFDRLQVGDLLFFGEAATDTTERRVVHVGMWIGHDQFIHSSGKVRISSVDSTAANFDPYNLDRYLEARRYLDNWQGNIIQAGNMYALEQ